MGGNGQPNGNGAQPGSTNRRTETAGTHLDSDILALCADAARKGIERVEEQDPLSEDKRGYYPTLLIGAQMSYDPAVWRPDYSLLPEDDPERKAAEQGEHRPFSKSKRYIRAHELMEKLDTSSNFNTPDD